VQETRIWEPAAKSARCQCAAKEDEQELTATFPATPICRAVTLLLPRRDEAIRDADAGSCRGFWRRTARRAHQLTRKPPLDGRGGADRALRRYFEEEVRAGAAQGREELDLGLMSAKMTRLQAR